MPRTRIYTDDERKIRAREACARWAAKNDRTEYHRKYDSTRPTQSRMFQAAQQRAKAAELPFDITVDDILLPEVCPICDNRLEVATGIRGGSRQSPTLDRIKCDEGYVKGNIAVICKNCNSKKGHASADELRRIADWMDQQAGITYSSTSDRK